MRLVRAVSLFGTFGVVVFGLGCGDDATPIADAAGLDGAGANDAATSCACDDGLFCNGVERCGDDGECLEGTMPCGAGTFCDEATDRCTTDCGTTRDADGDGVDAVECGGTDCDDSDPRRSPERTEICDAENLDEDCDPSTFGSRDDDGDGFVDARCCNGGNCGTDCVDTVASIRPGAVETCNGLDDDCDGSVDEGVSITFFEDRDRDGHGAIGEDVARVEACAAPPGFAQSSDDCDDDEGSIHPGAYDRCDDEGVDDDCNGTPNDPPGGCACTDGSSRGCPLAGVCARGSQTCVAGRWSECSILASAEICGNGEDDDCDGAVDDGCECLEPFRFCGSDVGTCTRGLQRCASDGAWGPCVDAVEPRPETCNELDDDCDGLVDEGVFFRCFADPDGDGFSIPSAARMELCASGCPSGTTSRDPTVAGGEDCDPSNPQVFPGQTLAFRMPRGDGTYDYDCDGFSTPEWPVIGSCVASPTGSCLPTSADLRRMGYANAAGCGQSTTFVVCQTIPTMVGDTCREVYDCRPGETCDENRVACR